jgi:tRNA (guanine37-N1)-methyltransferase
MVMKPEPIFAAIEAVYQSGPIILLTPQGRLFNQHIATELAQEQRVTLLCGHYEGIDERVRQHLVTDEISIGDYVLTGGELAAMIVVDAVSRLMPGVLADDSTQEESHTSGLLEYPQYTRPPEFRGWRIPDVLLSGHHEQIAHWRRKESLRLTRQRRPDLFAQVDVSSKLDTKLLKELDAEEGN